MKIQFSKILPAVVISLVGATNSFAAAQGFYAMKAPTIEGAVAPLSKYDGKVTLVVNTASLCGFTPQYKALEELYTKYKDRGFVVLGFPSNDFGSQEPGTNAEIKNFCERTFKVTFPMFAKDKVTGDAKQPVYKFLTEHAQEKGEISWNFEKFLINKKGDVVGRFKSKVEPMSAELTGRIEALLK